MSQMSAQPSKARCFSANLFLALMSILITFTILEVSARIYLLNFAPLDQFIRYASVNQLRRGRGDDQFVEQHAIFSPHRYIGYYPTPNYREENGDRHNSLGYRGEEIEVPKPDETFRIVCLGGSTTYSRGVGKYTKSYPYQLQEYLRGTGYSNVEVVNAGVSGYSSWESLANLEFRVLDLEPDMIIIYHGINDVQARFVWPPSAYQGDNSGALRSNPQDIRMPPIWQYSTALRMLAIMAGRIEPHSALDWHQNRPRPETYYRDLFEQQFDRGIYPSGFFLEVPVETMLDENPPIYFERNLTNMVAIAQANDITVVLMTFAYSPLFSDEMQIVTPEYQRGLAESQQVVRDVSATTGAHLFDFAEVMPPDEEYYTDGRHFTSAGNELRAQLLGDFLISNDLLSSPDYE